MTTSKKEFNAGLKKAKDWDGISRPSNDAYTESWNRIFGKKENDELAESYEQSKLNKKERINGMNGTECLMKAKSMFEEMNLEWDLKEYEKYMEGN